MSAAFNHMSAAQIRTRLDEIARAEKAHATRDLDGELADVMRGGGDVDAIEAAHLDAERHSRRLRVERKALETELPLAVRREGRAKLVEHQRIHAELAVEARQTAEFIATRWQGFREALDAWDAIQQRAEDITHEAWLISLDSEAEMPELGRFISMKVAVLGKEAGFVDQRLASAEREMQVGSRVQGHRIDG